MPDPVDPVGVGLRMAYVGPRPALRWLGTASQGLTLSCVHATWDGQEGPRVETGELPVTAKSNMTDTRVSRSPITVGPSSRLFVTHLEYTNISSDPSVPDHDALNRYCWGERAAMPASVSRGTRRSKRSLRHFPGSPLTAADCS